MAKTIEPGKRDQRGYAMLSPGEVPKPRRLTALTDYISRTHGEVIGAENMTSLIALKDPRTVKSYHIALARLKLAQLELEEITEILQFALHGRATGETG